MADELNPEPEPSEEQINNALRHVVPNALQLPGFALTANHLPADYRDLYETLVRQALHEFPPIHGYQTVHTMLVERATYLFVIQKEQDAKLETDINWKTYKLHLAGFIRTMESLLKEAKAIGFDQSFKRQFAAQVIDIIDRNVKSKNEKQRIQHELSLLVAKRK